MTYFLSLMPRSTCYSLTKIELSFMPFFNICQTCELIMNKGLFCFMLQNVSNIFSSQNLVRKFKLSKFYRISWLIGTNIKKRDTSAITESLHFTTLTLNIRTLGTNVDIYACAARTRKQARIETGIFRCLRLSTLILEIAQSIQPVISGKHIF